MLFKQGELSKAQAITGSAVASTNYINLGSKGDAIGNELYLNILVDTVFASGTDLSIDLQTDDNADFSSPKKLLSLPSILTANLTAGKVLFQGRLPQGCEGFLNLKYTPNGTFTTGKITAYLSMGIDNQLS